MSLDTEPLGLLPLTLVQGADTNLHEPTETKTSSMMRANGLACEYGIALIVMIQVRVRIKMQKIHGSVSSLIAARHRIGNGMVTAQNQWQRSHLELILKITLFNC